jgi:hypothetical protein
LKDLPNASPIKNKSANNSRDCKKCAKQSALINAALVHR